MRILISACLLGLYCRYDGKLCHYASIRRLVEQYDWQWIPCCPEQAGGLPTPRVPAERCGSRILTAQGREVTEAYEKGAAQAVYLAKLFQCRYAILKEKSPSCGCDRIYDGSFQHRLCAGQGVTAERLQAMGVQVFGETQVARFLQTVQPFL